MVQASRIPRKESTRAATIRHVAIVVAVVLVWALRSTLIVHAWVLWTLGCTALANSALVVLADRHPESRLLRCASPAIGVVAWGTLIGLTGGTTSPLLAGLWLEVMLAPLAGGQSAVGLVALGACTVLWIQQWALGIDGRLGELAIQSAFVLAAAAITYWWHQRSRRRELALLSSTAELRQRIESLEQTLDDAQAMGRLGERVGQLAHSAKSTIHSLRGFASLLEQAASGDVYQRRALEGLSVAIERLDALARLMLRSSDQERPSQPATSWADLSKTLADVVDETQIGLGCACTILVEGSSSRAIAFDAQRVRQVVTALVENAAEATLEASPITLKLETDQAMVHISVADEGRGISPAAREQLFRPGNTTKPNGNGFGLFFARRLVESAGGRLKAESGRTGGAVFTMSLPLSEG